MCSPLPQPNDRRRGAVIVWTAISAVMLLGFAALAVDLGYVRLVRNQLQNAADAAALAGASALLDPAQAAGYITEEDLANEARSRAMAYSARNPAGGGSVQLALSDIDVGNVSSPTSLQQSIAAGATPYNAVRVVTRKDSSVANGPVYLFFARIWGKNTTDVSATATAYLSSNMSGYHAGSGGGPLIPISLRKQKWESDFVNGLGGDAYGYDTASGTVTLGSDGIPEISIYPEKQKKVNEEGGGGNFGILNFGVHNVGASTVEDQIAHGLTADDFRAVFGDEQVEFYQYVGPTEHPIEGEPVLSLEYQIEGNPGLMASLNDVLTSRIGQVVGFFIHDEVVKDGSNAVFTVVGIQFGRLMSVHMTGSPDIKAVVIQPTSYVGWEVITDENVPPSPTGGNVQLIR